MHIELGGRGLERSELVEVRKESFQQFAVMLAVIVDQ